MGLRESMIGLVEEGCGLRVKCKGSLPTSRRGSRTCIEHTVRWHSEAGLASESHGIYRDFAQVHISFYRGAVIHIGEVASGITWCDLVNRYRTRVTLCYSTEVIARSCV